MGERKGNILKDKIMRHKVFINHEPSAEKGNKKESPAREGKCRKGNEIGAKIRKASPNRLEMK